MAMKLIKHIHDLWPLLTPGKTPDKCEQATSGSNFSEVKFIVIPYNFYGILGESSSSVKW